MCKMNPFFAVSSHSPLPATDTVINMYEIHTVGFSCHCWTLTLPTCDWEIHRTSATNHSWSRKLEAMKTQTSHHRLWNNHRSMAQVKLGKFSQEDNITAQNEKCPGEYQWSTPFCLLLTSQDHKNHFISGHVRPLKLDFTLVPNPLMSSNPQHPAFLQSCISSQISSQTFGSKHLLSQLTPCFAFLN